MEENTVLIFSPFSSVSCQERSALNFSSISGTDNFEMYFS